ncbi:MAG: transglutaminase domain-containing protein [Candidatus Saccharibacteria bacterium]
MVRFSPKVQVICALLAVAVIGSALASAFEQVEIGKVIDNSGRDQNILNRTGRWSGNGPLVVESTLMGTGNIFTIQGRTNTTYLRTNVYATYADGEWISTANYQAYNGEVLSGPGLSHIDMSVVIVPTAELHGQLPAMQRTVVLTPIDAQSLEYEPELHVFRTTGYLSVPYSIDFNSTAPLSDELRLAGVVGSDEYLQIPDTLRSSIIELAQFIVQNETDPFDQANLLVAFLKEHYTYTTLYSQTPAGKDEVEWFLFNSKMGMCTHFNSAFVLLARSLGIPTRICSGYLVNEYVDSQEISSEDAHAYAEIRFGEDQWVIFDATPDVPGGPGWLDPDESDTTPSLYGWLFDDKDQNQVKDFTDPALQGWTVMLKDSQGTPLAITTTSAAGLYTFDVVKGDYIVQPFTREGYFSTTASSWSGQVDMGSGQVSFGFNYSASLYGGTTETTTAITSNGGDLLKGEPFHVQGTVTSSGQTPGGPRVHIYVAPSKTSPSRVLIGEGELSGGNFDVQCILPNDLPVGDYQLIARYVSNYQFAASESDPAVKVWDETTISVSGLNTLVAEFGGTIELTLREKASKEVIPYADLTVSFDHGSVVNTGPYGTGALYLEPGQARTLALNVSYAGSQYLLNSSYFAPVIVPGLKVELLKTELTRNATGKVIGLLYAGSNTIPKSVYTSIEWSESAYSTGMPMESWSLDSMGRFVFDVPVYPWTPLGPHGFLVTIGDMKNFTTVNLNVTALPVLNVTASGNMVSAILLDDTGQPLSGQPIKFSTPYSSRTVITDGSGRASGTMEADGDCNCTVSYPGASYYLAVEAKVPIKGNGLSMLWWALIPAAVIPAIYLISRYRPRGHKAAEIIEEGPPGPYTVTSPQLAAGMPLVWEAGLPIDIVVDGGDGPLNVSIDGQSSLVQRGQIIHLELPKGDHPVVVTGPSGKNVYMLRLVDYRTEIAKLYVEQVSEWATKYDHIKLPMAPREVQLLMGRTERTAEEMEAIVSLFEQAQYSVHAIGRGEYERMLGAVRGAAG